VLGDIGNVQTKKPSGWPMRGWLNRDTAWQPTRWWGSRRAA